MSESYGVLFRVSFRRFLFFHIAEDGGRVHTDTEVVGRSLVTSPFPPFPATTLDWVHFSFQGLRHYVQIRTSW